MTRCFRGSTCGTVVCVWAMALGASAGHAADCAPPSPAATSYTADNCRGTVAGGTFDTGAAGYASVLHAANGGSITVTGPVSLHSEGDNSTGAYAESSGAIRFEAPGSTLTMLGAHSNGVHAFGQASISGQVNIVTSGERAHAVFADYGGVVLLHDTSIVTHGAEAAGLGLAAGAITLLGRSAILTTGDVAPGVALTAGVSNVVVDGQGSRISIRTTGQASFGSGSAEGQGTIVLRNVDIVTKGAASYGIFAQGTTGVQADNTTIETAGPAAIGVRALDGGTIALRGGSVTTMQARSVGLSVQGPGSTITADGTAVGAAGERTSALQVEQGGHLAFVNGSATGTGVDGSVLALSDAGTGTLQTATVAASTLSAPQGAAIRVASGPASIVLSGSSVTGPLLLAIDSGPTVFRVDVDASATYLRGAVRAAPAADGSAAAATMTLRDGSTWWITGNSNLLRLDNLGSTLAFVAPTDAVFHTLTLQRYHSEGGTLAMTAALGGDGSPSDRLVIDAGRVTGTTALRIVNAGGKGALTDQGIPVIVTANGGAAPDGTFTLAGRAVAGPYEYQLYRGGLRDPADGNWYLRSQQLPMPPDPPVPPPAPPTPPTPSRPMYRPEVPAYIANQYAAASLFLHSLHDRMGELPFSSAPAGWLRLAGKTAESGSPGNDYSARADTVILHGGGDFARGSLFGAADRLHVGAMLGYGNVRTDGLAAGNAARAHGEVNGYGAGVYATWFGQAAADRGPYVDTWFQYAWFDSSVRGDQLPKVGYRSQAWNVSIEGGWALPLAGSSWLAEPQAQVAWLRHRGVSVTEPGGTQVNGGDTSGVMTRLGVRLFRTLDRGDGGRLQPYATVNWWHDQASASVGFNDTLLGQLFPRDRYELKLGLDARLARGWSSWGNIGGQWGSQGYRQYALRLGARYAW